ncbi:MAG: TolC family outer membrane protein [Methylophilus sp.]|jgi:protease secretion system outer membrane protein
MMSVPIKVLVILLIMLLLPSTPLNAAENLLSLYQAALNYDAQYKNAVANTQADREEIEKARALFYPKAQLSGSIGRGNTDRTTQSLSGAIDAKLNYNTQNLTLAIKQPIFNKETMATYRSAQALVKGKESLLESETSNLITRVANAYFELLHAEEKSSVAQNQIVALEQQLDQANKRYQYGAGTITEVSEAQASLDIAQADLVEANNSADTYRLLLSNMTGHEIYALAKLNPDTISSLNIASESLDDWLKTAIDNNPEIIAAQYALEMAQHEIEKKQAGHYPTLDLVGARSYSENDSNNTIGAQYDTTTIALQFSMPLYAGGYVSAGVRQSIDKLEAAKENLNLKTRDVTTNIKKYFQQMQSELRSIQAYHQAVKSSEIALDGTSKSFIGGLRTNIDVLNAQQRLYENKLKLSKSYYMLVNDMVNIKHTAGELNTAQLQEMNRFFVVN